MSRRVQKPIDRLLNAMDACARSRGEASWVQGYRARFEASYRDTRPDEAQRLYQKEQALFAVNARAERNFRRLSLKLLREAAKVPAKRRGDRR